MKQIKPRIFLLENGYYCYEIKPTFYYGEFATVDEAEKAQIRCDKVLKFLTLMPLDQLKLMNDEQARAAFENYLTPS